VAYPSHRVINNVCTICCKIPDIDRSSYSVISECVLIPKIFQAASHDSFPAFGGPYSIDLFNLLFVMVECDDVVRSREVVYTLPPEAYESCIATCELTGARKCLKFVTKLLMLGDPAFQAYFGRPATIQAISEDFVDRPTFEAKLEWLKFSCALMGSGDLEIMSALLKVGLVEMTHETICEPPVEPVGYYFLTLFQMISPGTRLLRPNCVARSKRVWMRFQRILRRSQRILWRS
jgi:hypothetical protein